MKTTNTISPNSLPSPKSLWFITAVAFFLLAALFGALMRLSWLVEIPSFLDYKHLLHAHSHLSMLGWGFTAVAGALLFLIVKASPRAHLYKRVLWLNVAAGVGMAIFFTYQGYGFFSIAFSTVHLAAAYWFAYLFLQDLRLLPGSTSTRFARWAVYWMLLSTIGLWAIAPVSALLGKLHPLYYASIQFFLHFQFNGWFTYAVIALLIAYVNQHGKQIAIKNTTFWMLQLSLLLTYTLSITWSTPETFLFYLNSLGVLLQAAVYTILLRKLYAALRGAWPKIGIAALLLKMGILSLLFKILVQMAVAIPAVAEISYTIRNFVIGFIHLTMLGSISLVLIALLIEAKLLPLNRPARSGYFLLAAAFLCTEIILFGQGVLLWLEMGFVPFYYEAIFIATLFFPIALLLMLSAFRAYTLNQSFIHVKTIQHENS